ncbi:forkhead box protein B1-like [Actinia tenebrosa]|uniref:Forkhead box protein B1-like n=1 Tax=Actinia tenebrosa TaxID=6105 RepID=A0A6P8J4M3_ACTTE|nr:forkhead box protein B1-like [Actinia tenebrosa]
MASKEGKVRKSTFSQYNNDFIEKKDEKTSNEGSIENEMPQQRTMQHADSEQEDRSEYEDTELTRKQREVPTIITKTNKINCTEESIKDGASKSEDDCDVKPSHSYIALIAMAILSCTNKKMILGDIYQYISDNFPYYRNKDKSWRNSIRHNLSLNECFIKAGRSENGKGNYWAIHPANLEDFSNGDFRRRRARRRVRKSNTFKYSSGLSGYPYLRGYAPLSAYSTFLPYKSDEYNRMCSSGYSSYAFTSGNRKNFAIDNIITPSSYKNYYPGTGHHSLIYDKPNFVSPYPIPPPSSDTMDTKRCSAAPAVVGCTDRNFSGSYASSLSALASLSNSHRGNESWQDTLCKLQENLKKPSRET